LRDLGWDGDRTYPLPETFFDDFIGRGPAERYADMSIATAINLERDTKFVAPARLTPEQRVAWDAYYAPRNADFISKHLTGDALARWKYQRFLHDYLGCIKGIDDNVGRILDYLDETGLAENTIVVYASDQGFFLGEHGWFDKRWIFQESARTPLLVRWPTIVTPGSSTDRIVSNLDIAETFLEAAGVSIPARMQGRSLVPLLRGETPADWRQSFYFHYYEFPAWCRVAPHYGIITDRYTMAHVQTPVGRPPAMDYWELFDRERDPRELTSVYDQPAYREIQQQLHEELARLRAHYLEPGQDNPAAFGAPSNY
ncbi:MAG: DUF4976 domain-containing protein, partial [Opitutaceae bacterium]|nr:DUF4976 domain-containing protein [Opitutaceae bacterium]